MENIKKIVEKLQIRRNKEIVNFEKVLIESFISGSKSKSFYPENYLELQKYLSYFQNHCKLKPILESVEEYESPVFTTSSGIPYCPAYRQHIVFKFKDYDLDIKGLQKMLLKEIYNMDMLL